MTTAMVNSASLSKKPAMGRASNRMVATIKAATAIETVKVTRTMSSLRSFAPTMNRLSPKS